jgi:thiol-disulfide isomerase/thioredoxin
LSDGSPRRWPRSWPQRWPHWTTLGFIAIGLWATPRLLPHLGALADVRARDASRPVYAVRTLAGDALTSDALRGQVVLVNVWATWCLPCRAEMPALESTWQRHKDGGLVVIGASVDRGNPADVAAFVRARAVSYPVAIGIRRRCSSAATARCGIGCWGPSARCRWSRRSGGRWLIPAVNGRPPQGSPRRGAGSR